MRSFKALLEASAKTHGHLCAGQVIGVRMAMLGCRLIRIDDPMSDAFRKKIMVYVEMDRCATDAISSVTGCRLGRRTMKFRDFGINAATFVNLDTRDAYRVVSTERSRDLVKRYAPEEEHHYRQQMQGYKIMPENELFDVQRVSVHLGQWEMPGPPRSHATCAQCGQVVRDAREVHVNGEILCRICSGEGYFQPLASVAV
ncbi:MAG: formylmethanofuran dehydrogenase [Desulfobacter sp.]|nr:MAG: formylmethanofuran dehydrogenase [Desulfobacter sp.]